MARPWRKNSAWPYVAKSGRKSYAVGFYDHERVERSRSFPSVRHARAWMDDYITAERRGRDSLRRFLLDLDAKEINEAEGRAIGEVLELYLAVSAHPRNEGGLAPSTYDRYEWTVGHHLNNRPRLTRRGGTSRPPSYAVAVARVPAGHFNKPHAPRAWRENMLRAGVSKPTRDQAWSVLSAALSWAAASQLVPEIEINGCSLATEPRVNRRRSMRDGGTGYAPTGRRRGLGVASWALSPQAVEAIRAEMLLRSNGRRGILPQRDAMVVSLSTGSPRATRRSGDCAGHHCKANSLGCSRSSPVARLRSGARQSTARKDAPPYPASCKLIYRSGGPRWKARGHPTRECDFIIPGDLTGTQFGVRDSRTGACHLTASQAHSWGTRFFTPAVKTVVERPEFALVLGATPYALRRGGISLRLRAEDPQTVASECGTSLKMLSDHYSYALEDLRRGGPRPADVEWRAARAAQMDRHSHEQEVLAIAADHERARRGRKSLVAWFSRRRGASGTL